jgi:superfamily II DNA or RNA helicase
MGYALDLKSTPPHFIQDIKRELCVKPIENPNYPGGSTSFKVYRVSNDYIYVPRYYGIRNYNTPSINTLKTTPIDIEFNGTLRPIQQQAISKAMIAFNDFGGGLIALDTGLGKTVVALNIITQLKAKTLVVVHAQFLLEQWIACAKQYIPTARIGTIRQNTFDVEDKDIVIGMIQSITNREYPKEQLKSFGFMIVDECFKYSQNIKTDVGYIPIGMLHDLWKSHSKTPKVYSFSHTTGMFEYCNITYAWQRSNNTFVKIGYCFRGLIHGTFECTPNHLILTTNGYIEASKLKINDSIECSNGVVQVVSLTIDIGDYIDVYDIEVEGNHNFVLKGVSTDYGNIGPNVHNCHHLGSKTFSSIFYKVQTKYMLGLSATPDRKDGLTNVIYDFLGPLIIHIERDTDKPSITFVEADVSKVVEKFNSLGKVNGPIMITNLTKDSQRNEFIIDIIKQYSVLNRKILVLSDRREHCEVLKNGLDVLGISAGVYLGGMKQYQREESVDCSVILGTYQSSGEGFNVPELDTLILATPKSDVKQAVGRITRQKNPNAPLVIDIVDKVSLFQGQYYKRRKFYTTAGFVFNK